MTSSYRAALRLVLRTAAVAYGYTLTVASTVAMLTAVRGKPGTGELFLFVAGGLAGFALLEVVLLLARPRSDASPDDAFPFAGALNVLSVCAGLGAAIGLAHAFESSAAWALAPLGATFAYMLVVALQVALVERVRGY